MNSEVKVQGLVFDRNDLKLKKSKMEWTLLISLKSFSRIHILGPLVCQMPGQQGWNWPERGEASADTE